MATVNIPLCIVIFKYFLTLVCASKLQMSMSSTKGIYKVSITVESMHYMARKIHENSRSTNQIVRNKSRETA